MTDSAANEYAQDSLKGNLYSILKTSPPAEAILPKLKEISIDKIVMDSVAERVKQTYRYGFSEGTNKYMIHLGKCEDKNFTKEEFRQMVTDMFNTDVALFSERLIGQYTQNPGLGFMLPVTGLAALTLVPLVFPYPAAIAISAAYAFTVSAISFKRQRKRIDLMDMLFTSIMDLRDRAEKTDMLALFERNEDYFKGKIKEYERTVANL